MPLPFSVNTIHPDLKPIKVFTRDSVVPIPFLTEIPVPIPSCREKSRDFDPALGGIGIGFGKKIGIGTVPPDPKYHLKPSSGDSAGSGVLGKPN